MIKELILAQQICYVCLPPPDPPWLPTPGCPLASQVSNPSRCAQNGAPYIVDGCSIPQQIADVLAGGDRNNPVRGAVNFGSTAFGVEQWSIPATLAHHISQLPCNQHDKCYKTCGMTQSICDLGFGQSLNGVCARAYPSVLDCPNFMPPLNSPLRCALYAAEAAKCVFIAGSMGGAVALAGRSAYRQNQDRHCNCCGVH